MTTETIDVTGRTKKPFLLKLNMERTGTFSVRATIDGVQSNTLEFVVQ